MEKFLKAVKRKRPLKLSKINEGDTKQKLTIPANLQKLLEPNETVKFDDIDYSGSEISDPFEAYHKNNYLSKSKSDKTLSKLEADHLTMASFTDHFKKVMKDTRDELQLQDNLMTENLEDVEKILSENREQQDLPETLKVRIEELLKNGEYIRSTPSALSEEDISTRRESSPTGAMSGVWNMLQAHCKDKNFEISTPNFNAFQQEKAHWLDRPSITWETLNFSRVKCEKWLDEINEQNT